MNYTLPEEMYTLPSNTLEIIGIIEKTPHRPFKLMLEFMVILIIMVIIFTMITATIYTLTGNQNIAATVHYIFAGVYLVVSIIGVVYFLNYDAVNPLKEKYPMVFIAWKPDEYILTTDYKVKPYYNVSDDKIIDINIEKIKTEKS